jgi:DNA-binding MarR family transcriptional regulator
MKLEEEIKQVKPFKSEYHKLVVNIQVTSSWLNGRFAQMLKPFDITPPQYNVLRILSGRPGGCCNHEITERMIDKSSNSTRIVDKLVEKKLIIRSENKQDRRLVDIRITEKGLELLNGVETIMGADKKKSKPFNEEKAKLMNEWLDELRNS